MTERTLIAALFVGAAIISGITLLDAIQPNDVLRNMRTGQAGLVTAVTPATGVLAITWFGTNAAGNAGDKLLFVGSAHKQGGPLPARTLEAIGRLSKGR